MATSELSLREVHSAEEVLEAGVGAQGVEARVGGEEDRFPFTILEGAVQFLEGFVEL